ncbi:MAG: hypothetical protein CMJ19_07870 [Phycisphaeraceae bacterium]|nr:hypothetical protein [Phycisphaeraceae bacterium]
MTLENVTADDRLDDLTATLRALVLIMLCPQIVLAGFAGQIIINMSPVIKFHQRAQDRFICWSLTSRT